MKHLAAKYASKSTKHRMNIASPYVTTGPESKIRELSLSPATILLITNVKPAGISERKPASNGPATNSCAGTGTGETL